MSLPEDHIAVTNVRPAYEASLARGVREAELADLGLSQALMAQDDASVPGETTYRHMEWMQKRGDFGDFVVDAANRHGGESLGVVGLACKTVPTMQEAFLCHARFQHLTNRTARYLHTIEGEHLRLTEYRSGPPSRGSMLISDYTMLVAIVLLQLLGEVPVPVFEVSSRRPKMAPSERQALEQFFGRSMQTGASHATLLLPGDILQRPIPRADPELATYFQQVLHRAARFEEDESELVARCRLAIQEALAKGTPTTGDIGRRLGMSPRTLQRHLQSEDLRLTDLIADTRMRLAKGYLLDPSLSVTETAFLLGYSEDTSFFRAFKRWTGVTPSQWRTDNSP